MFAAGDAGPRPAEFSAMIAREQLVAASSPRSTWEVVLPSTLALTPVVSVMR